MTHSPSTVNQKELAKFKQLANQWWDIDGDFKALHRINPLRLRYIIKHINESFRNVPLSRIRVLDIGAGGGLVSIPLAQTDLQVEGLDIVPENVQVATLKAKELGLKNVHFTCQSIEERAAGAISEEDKFDAIVAFEVIEHVDNLELFIAHACSLLKPNGIFLLSTINRTLKSLLLAKIGAEYVLCWVPKGTHSWNKFVRPTELQSLMPSFMCFVDFKGLKLNIIDNKWSYSDDLAINYFACFQKKDY